MRSFIILFALIFFNSVFCFSQSKKKKAELYNEFKADSIKIATPKFIRPQFRIESRASIFDGTRINFAGFDAGVLLKNKLRLTVGYYKVDKDYQKKIDTLSIKKTIKLECINLNAEIIYFSSRYFAMGFPLELGFGQYKFSSITNEKNPISKSGIMSFVNFGVSGTFKPIRWFGLKGIAGYRKSLFPTQKLDFNGPFASIGLNVDVQEIIKDARMYRLKKNYYKDLKKVETLIDLITD